MITCNTLETFHILLFVPETTCLIFLIVINAVNGSMDIEVTPCSRTSEITLDLLRNLYNGGQGHGSLHRPLTTLHSASLPNLHKLLNECDQLIAANREQRFRSIVLDVCSKILFFPVRTGTNSTSTKPLRRFIKVFFHNKWIDKVKLTAILHNKLVRPKVSIYFQEQVHHW